MMTRQVIRSMFAIVKYREAGARLERDGRPFTCGKSPTCRWPCQTPAAVKSERRSRRMLARTDVVCHARTAIGVVHYLVWTQRRV